MRGFKVSQRHAVRITGRHKKKEKKTKIFIHTHTNKLNIRKWIKREKLGNVKRLAFPTIPSFIILEDRLSSAYLPAVVQAFTFRKQAADLVHILQWFILLSINHKAYMWYNQIKATQADKQAGDFQTYAFSFISPGEPLQFIVILRLILQPFI